jgi:hypothetical protein
MPCSRCLLRWWPRMPRGSSHVCACPALQAVPEVLATATASPSIATQHSLQQQASTSRSDGLLMQAAPAQPPAPARLSSSSYWESSAGGCVVAMSLLMAIRQGRSHADAARLDVRALQGRQQDSRVQVREGAAPAGDL